MSWVLKQHLEPDIATRSVSNMIVITLGAASSGRKDRKDSFLCSGFESTLSIRLIRKALSQIITAHHNKIGVEYQTANHTLTVVP